MRRHHQRRFPSIAPCQHAAVRRAGLFSSPARPPTPSAIPHASYNIRHEMSCCYADAIAAPAQEGDERLIADSPAPPPSAARWRVTLYRTLHSPRAHLFSTLVIVLDVLCNVAGLLLSLFTCGREPRPSAVNAAEVALRYTSVVLLATMLVEWLARGVAVGLPRFLRIATHVLDGGVLCLLLAVEVAVSDRAAEEALGLLVVLRLARLLRLLSGMNEYAATRREEARDARVRALEARVAELQAALRAAEDKLAVSRVIELP